MDTTLALQLLFTYFCFFFPTAENVVGAWMNEQEYQACFDIRYRYGITQSISL